MIVDFPIPKGLHPEYILDNQGKVVKNGPLLRYIEFKELVDWSVSTNIDVFFKSSRFYGCAFSVIADGMSDSEFDEWCHEYFEENKVYHVNKLSFKNDTEAMYFKLRWC